ncbi:hypothetical protein DRN50_08165 [Thermococci archaeon]|nr:MAG: hypothetical protein DRN50_08165 [Thermococci archaeon]
MKIKEVTSRRNVKYSLIFLLLSIVFWELCPRLIAQYTMETCITPKLLSFFSLNGILLLLVGAICYTPYVVFIYRRKYETFLLSFLVPSIIIYIYTFSTLGPSLIAFYHPYWSFWYLIPAFILIYILKRSKSLKGDIFGIIFFCILNSISGIFLPLSAMYEGSWVGPPFSFSLDMIAICIVQGVFAALYLIILSFFIKKVFKVKVMTNG